jgi:hypothetical protein
MDKADFPVQFLETGDWSADILNYLKDPAQGAPRKIQHKAIKYVLIGDDMFYRTLEGLLLSAWDRLRQIGSCTRFMKEPMKLINRLIR